MSRHTTSKGKGIDEGRRQSETRRSRENIESDEIGRPDQPRSEQSNPQAYSLFPRNEGNLGRSHPQGAYEVASSNAARAGTEPSSSSRLTRLGQDFANIDVDDFERCYRFIRDKPDILKCDPDTFLQEAIICETLGKHVLAAACIQRAVMLRNCKNLSSQERLPSLKELINYKDSQDAFRKKVSTALAYVKQRVEQSTLARDNATTRATPENNASAQTRDGNDRLQIGQQNYESYTSYGSNPRHSSGSVNAAAATSTVPTSDLANMSISSHDRHVQPVRSERSRSFNNGSRAPRHQETTRQRASIAEDPSEDVRSAISIEASIVDTAGNRESLNENYFRRPSNFFKIGRVFAVLWHENATGGKRPSYLSNDEAVETRFGQRIHSHIRRFAVVKLGHGYSTVVEINTYGGQGVGKRGLSRADIQAHAIIHMSNTGPVALEMEPKMRKRPIGVDPASVDQKLNKASRIRFDKVHTVEHNVKVMNVGWVSKESMAHFVGYRNEYR